MRRATHYSLNLPSKPIDNFYPRSPCGERPTNHDQATNTHRISIHALLAESDAALLPTDGLFFLFLSTLSLRRATQSPWMYFSADLKGFLSTLSLRRATHYGWSWYDDFTISIHALLAESDVMDTLILANAMLFLSTLSLRRATVRVVEPGLLNKLFLSTLSLRRATWGG